MATCYNTLSHTHARSPERWWQELQSLVPKPHLLEQRVTYRAETGQGERRSMRGHSNTQAPDCGALFYLSATLEPATHDTHEQLRRVMQKCATVPTGCTATALRMGAGIYLGTCTQRSTFACQVLHIWLGGGGTTYFTFKLFVKLLKY